MDKRDFTKTRSGGYQWTIMETPCAPEQISDHYDQNNVFYSGYNEELLDLQDQLKAAYWRLIETKLTERQKEVIKLIATGMTQMEVAKLLGINQSSITKSMHGNKDYSNNQRRSYGGSARKLVRLAAKDPEIQEILKKISELEK